jgi:hypothetical protein
MATIIQQIKAVRSAGGPIAGSDHVPVSFAELLVDIDSVPMHFVEPDPRTAREDYYYNTRLNKLYVKVKTEPVYVWRVVGG